VRVGSQREFERRERRTQREGRLIRRWFDGSLFEGGSWRVRDKVVVVVG